MLNTSNVKQALKVDIAITTIMADALNTWALMYQNQAPWVGGDTKSLNLAATIAAEIARAVTIEMGVRVRAPTGRLAYNPNGTGVEKDPHQY